MAAKITIIDSGTFHPIGDVYYGDRAFHFTKREPPIIPLGELAEVDGTIQRFKLRFKDGLHFVGNMAETPQHMRDFKEIYKAVPHELKPEPDEPEENVSG